jgi:hypothetical protein
MKDPGISWRLAYHEASHAVMYHFLFRDKSIRSVRTYALTGEVVLEEEFCYVKYDPFRLPGVVAGSIGEWLYAKKHVKASTRTLAEYASGDMEVINEIMADHCFPSSHLTEVKRRVARCLKTKFVRIVVSDVAALLHEKLFRLAYVKKSLPGTLVHKVINDSLARLAATTNGSIEDLRKTAAKLLLL